MVSTPSGFDVMKMLMLLFSGGDVNYKQDDQTLLSIAVTNDNWLYAQTLILFGVDLFYVDDIGWTAFHHSVYANSYHSLLVLLRNGKEKDILTLRDRVNDNPLDIAIRNSNKECQVLLNGNLSWTIPVDELVEMIEEYGCDFPEPFPILTNCPPLQLPSFSTDGTDTSPIQSSNENEDSDKTEDSSHFVKSAWKRGADVNEKKANRISVLLSSVTTTKETRRMTISETNHREFGTSSPPPPREPKELQNSKEKDSKIMNLISRNKSKRSTVMGNATKTEEKQKEPIRNPSLHNSPQVRRDFNNFASLDIKNFPDFYKNKRTSAIAKSFSSEDKPQIKPAQTTTQIYSDESESSDSDDGYAEDIDFKPPDFEPPPPPTSNSPLKANHNFGSDLDFQNSIDFQF